MTSPGTETTSRSAPGVIRVVFLGTPVFAVPSLRALHESSQTKVALVITQPDRPAGRGRRLTPSAVKTCALEHGLPVFQPERLRGQEVLDHLRTADADLFVIAAYGQLLRQSVLDIPRHGCLNVHPSLLPRHRGSSPIAAAILAGDQDTGVTIMLTDRGMDTGPILTQEAVPLGREETTASLTPRLAEIGADLLLRTVSGWVAGNIPPQPQYEAAATLSRQFVKEDGALDWTRSALDLERQVRALNPWPRAYTFANGKRLLVLLAQATSDHEPGTPGTVFAGTAKELLVAAGNGALRLDLVQPEGGREVSGQQFLGNNQGLTGRQLG
jgi:methionyl-tRNA formyltransferase